MACGFLLGAGGARHTSFNASSNGIRGPASASTGLAFFLSGTNVPFKINRIGVDFRPPLRYTTSYGYLRIVRILTIPVPSLTAHHCGLWPDSAGVVKEALSVVSTGGFAFWPLTSIIARSAIMQPCKRVAYYRLLPRPSLSHLRRRASLSPWRCVASVYPASARHARSRPFRSWAR